MSKEKLSFQIFETQQRIFARDGFKCMHPKCCRRAVELAHCISKGKHETSIIQEIWNNMFHEQRSFPWIFNNVINNDLNMMSSCRVHNDSFNIAGDPCKVQEKLYEIYDALIRSEVKN